MDKSATRNLDYLLELSEKEVSFEMRGRAFRICRDYLHGSWRKIEANDMVLKHISGGLSNHLFYCALPKSTPVTTTEPSEVLVRFYGQVHGEEALESLLAESVIFTLLSERRLGPRLYGVFPGGRLEQFIPARSMSTKELSIPEYSRQIALRMARMHSLNVPISKEPTWIWKSIQRWQNSSEDFLKSSHTNISPTAKTSSSYNTLEKLRQFPYADEVRYLQEIVSQIDSPVVFAHNDLQEGNILFNQNEAKLSDQISLIDFEYCSYNYRGFDLANHFLEWIYCYKVDQEPFFSVSMDSYPNRDQQLNFIRTYLNECDSLNGGSSSSGFSESINSTSNFGASSSFIPFANRDDPSSLPHPAEEKLLKEVMIFNQVVHLLWALWSIVQGHVSKIPFGYLEYALTRMNHYYESKNKLDLQALLKQE